MKGGKLAQEAWDIAREALLSYENAKNVVIADVEFVREGAQQILRLVIDSASPISMDDCADVSRLVDPALDERFSWQKPYQLVVESFGFDRPLVDSEAALRHLHERVELRLYQAKDKQKQFEGELCSVGEAELSLKLDNGEIRSFTWEEIAKLHRVVVF